MTGFGAVEEAALSQARPVMTLVGGGVVWRTVAKYREAMNIPSSVQRRRVMKGVG
jgi:DNA-directed RNA polymerase specialized sigma54-like protein